MILLAPFGEGVGGIVCQTNALVGELRKQDILDVEVIDTAQRYRAYCDLRLSKRLVGGGYQVLNLGKQLIFRALRFRPDSIHLTSTASYGLLRDLALAVLGRLLRARVFISFHFGRIPQLKAKRNWEWRLLLLTCRLADGVVVLDEQSKRALASALPRKSIEKIPNGIDLAWVDLLLDGAGRKGLEKPSAHLVFVGLILPAKGVVELVKACSRIASGGFTLEMVGPAEPEFKAELGRLAAVREAGDWLSFAGEMPRKEAVKRIAAADIFVLSSYSEGFPITVLEAMACSKPVLATCVGAIPEMLSIESEEPAGICVPPQVVEPLQGAIEGLLKDESRRVKLGAAGRKKCEAEYRLSKVARHYSAMWTGQPVMHHGQPTNRL